MQTSSQNSEHVIQVVFSVCASSEDAAAAMIAVSRVAGSEFAGEFQEYISANRQPQFSSALRAAPGCVALIDCDQDPELAIQTMRRLQQTFPNKISLVALSSETNASFLLQVMRAGCSDVIQKPVDAAALAEALTRFQNSHPPSAHATQDLGKVISFYGVKGGVGTTTLAVHLATHLVRIHRKKVLLIDHKHELGHVSLYLGIKDGGYYFDELIRNVDRLDADLLEGFVVRHPSGLEVIPSPDTAAVMHTSPAETIERVMEYLRRHYEFILIDSSLQYRDSIGAIVAASDEVSMICTPDVASLRDLARHIENLGLNSGFISKVRVIINRSTSDDAASPEQIKEAVRFPVSFSIPNSYADLMRAINSGEPVSPQQRGGFTQAVARWAKAVAGGPAVTTKASEPKRLFNFLRQQVPSKT
jgi:pilus assembly protein CpaE